MRDVGTHSNPSSFIRTRKERSNSEAENSIHLD
jgi:hypothetical protein